MTAKVVNDILIYIQEALVLWIGYQKLLIYIVLFERYIVITIDLEYISYSPLH